MSPVRCQFHKRLEHESPFVHPLMRQSHLRRNVPYFVIVRQQVQIQHPRSIGHSARTSKLRLHGVQDTKQRLGIVMGCHLKNSIHECRLVGYRNRGTSIPARPPHDNDVHGMKSTKRRCTGVQGRSPFAGGGGGGGGGAVEICSNSNHNHALRPLFRPCGDLHLNLIMYNEAFCREQRQPKISRCEISVERFELGYNGIDIKRNICDGVLSTRENRVVY